MFSLVRNRKRLSMIAASAVLLQTGACLPPDFLAALLGTVLTVAAEAAVSTVVTESVTGATDDTSTAQTQP
ncbi:MAG: hypothetical protein ACKVS9_08475 [Phycisphaerae bacterium]